MDSNHVIASMGLISDTHFQDRLFDLPDGLNSLWAGVDLILHAGDVGELDVLDQLSHIAPVVAVHGNDEPEHVKQALPDQQLVSIHGLRVLLWHSHYPDPAEERAKRSGTWGPKLDRIANYGRQMNANIMIYGHTHVPMVHRAEEVLLFNPGALASGSYFTRQAVVSVGRLQLLANGDYNLTHFDVSTGQAVQFRAADPDEEFSSLAECYQTWMVEPGLVADVAALRNIVYEDIRGVVRAIVPLYKHFMPTGLIMRRDLIEAIRASQWITANDRTRVLAIIDRG
jgi:putative phosphoesterase